MVPAQGREVRPARSLAEVRTLLRFGTTGPFIILAATFFLLYLPTFRLLIQTWLSRDVYSHGFLIPLISAYLVWGARSRLWSLTPQPNYFWGVPVTVVAGLMLLIGRAGSMGILEEASLIVCLAGLVLLIFGNPVLKVLFFPISYLIFMLPFAEELFGPLQWPLQLLTAKMSVLTLQGLGFPVLLENQFMVLPKITLEVAQVCSGSNYLMAIIAIGIPLAYLSLSNWSSRVFLILSGIAVGIAANWLRVILIAVGVFYGYPFLHGPFHVLQGLLVAQLGFVYLFAATWLLSKTPSERLKRAAGARPPVTLNGGEEGESPAAKRGYWTASGLLVGFLFLGTLVDRSPVSLREGLETFPTLIGEWTGKKENPSDSIFRLPGADQELLRSYRELSGGPVHLYVAYFSSQHQGKEIANYQTERLHQFAEKRTIQVGPKGAVSINDGRFTDQAGVRYPIVFWYEVNGRIVASPSRTQWSTIENALLRGRTNGTFVLVYGEGERDDGSKRMEEGEAFQEGDTFVQDLLPVLERYFQLSEK